MLEKGKRAYNEGMPKYEALGLKDTQKRYGIIFENHVDSDTGEIFNHYLRNDIHTLREREANGEATSEDLSLKWLLLKYRFPVEMRGFLINFVYGGDIDYSLFKPRIYFVDNLQKIVISDSNDPEDGWNKLQSRSKLSKLMSAESERKIVLEGNVTTEEIQAFLARNGKRITEQQFVNPSINYIHSRGVTYDKSLRLEYRILELIEDGAAKQNALWQVANDSRFEGERIPTEKQVSDIKKKIRELRDDSILI